MATQIWRYRVRDTDGAIRQDHLRAETLDDAMVQLRSQGADVVGVERVDIDDGSGEVQDRRRDAAFAGSDHGRGMTESREPRTARLEPDSQRPPPAPREIPRGTTGMAGGFVLILVGGAFVAIASIFIVVGIGLLLAGEAGGVFMTLFPMIHFSVGAGLLTWALRGKAKRRDVIANGRAALARVEETGIDRSTKINGRSPYRMVYEFDVDQRTYSGKRSTMNKRITTHRVGDRIWVLYDPDDPERNVEWPPL